MSEKIVLTHGCAPGDIVCMTALPRDIQAAYPGKYEIHVATHAKTLWKNNPHVAGVYSKPQRGLRQIKIDYGWAIRQITANKLHFITAFHRDFFRREKLQVPVLYPKGDLYIDTWKESNPPIQGRYWVVIAGGKSDFTCKIWSSRRWQMVVDQLGERGITVVQCGATHKGPPQNWQPELSNVVNLVDQTNLREMLWLIKHADGVICHVTFAAHVAAVFDKPCVVIAGGREHWWWEAYVNVAGVRHFGPYAQDVVTPHRFLHTQDLLDCCKGRGCWKNKVTRAEPDKGRSYCKLPVADGFGQTIPKCLEMITVDHVVEAVMTYYEDGTLPPISQNPQEKIVLPTGDPPPQPVVPKTTLDLFAPIDELMAQVQQPTPPPDDMLHNFAVMKGDNPEKPIVADPWDHEFLGGHATLCVLMYGDYHDMHKACLDSIIRTTAPARVQIRVGGNALCPGTRHYLEALHASGEIHKLYINPTNDKKYPVMRRMFHDREDPITDKWVLWFDDDTICNRDPKWFHKLGHKIIAEYPRGARMFGDLLYSTFNPTQMAWIVSRPWYKGRNFQMKNRREAPNGNKVFFASGAFWALSTEVMYAAGIPDEQFGHNGGDYMIGEQVWQAGYHTADWNKGKRFVHSSSVGRRGLDEVHTGMPGWVPGGVSKRR